MVGWQTIEGRMEPHQKLWGLAASLVQQTEHNSAHIAAGNDMLAVVQHEALSQHVRCVKQTWYVQTRDMQYTGL